MRVCAKCVSESWKNCVRNGAALDLDRKTSFPLTLPPPRLSASHRHPHHYHRIQTQTHVRFHTLSPFLVPSLPFTSSTSTGLSKWSQRIALWSNNPGGWHHWDGSVRGGEGTRKVREVEKVRKGKRETVEWRGSACVEIKMHREEPESKRVHQTWPWAFHIRTMLCVATFERLFRHATSLPLHNYKAKTDARVTMQKIKPSTAVKLLCAGWHRKEHTDSSQPWHQSLLPHFQFTTKLRVNCGWQDGENSPRHEAETSVNTGHKARRRCFLVSF